MSAAAYCHTFHQDRRKEPTVTTKTLTEDLDRIAADLRALSLRHPAHAELIEALADVVAAAGNSPGAIAVNDDAPGAGETR